MAITKQLGAKLQLIKALIQVEGNYDLSFTTHNYDHQGSVRFSGNHNDKQGCSVNFVVDGETVERLNFAESYQDVIKVYKEIGFFREEETE